MSREYEFPHRVFSAEAFTSRAMLQRGPYVSAGYFDACGGVEPGRLTPAFRLLVESLDRG
jgi:hypothetical protein